MPERIDITVCWVEDCYSMSYLSFYGSDIEDMVLEYDQGKQLLLFTLIPIESIRQWIWDQYCREPEEIIIDSIKF